MTIVIDSELTLGLFYLVSRIVFTFLLILDCMFIEFNGRFTYNTKFYLELLNCKFQNIINLATLTLPPT